jgi:signal transduction histidine kinase
MKYYIIKGEDHVIDNFGDLISQLDIKNLKGDNIITVKIDNKIYKARTTFKKSGTYSGYFLSVNKKLLSRKKFFDESVQLTFNTLRTTLISLEEERKSRLEQNEEFLHNVISLNSFGIQDLFDLIPQNILTENLFNQEKVVSEIINKKKDETISVLLNLIKYSLASKVEFSVFDRLNNQSSFKTFQVFPIRKVFLTVLQIFMKEFKSESLTIELAKNERMLRIDYDSMLVSLYYLFENALKYSCPITTIKINFEEHRDHFIAKISMISISIDDDEIDKLTVRGHRSDTAKLIHSKGQGLGMYRIKKTLKVNNAEMLITPRINDYKTIHKGVKYEGNEFKIIFNNQYKII